MNTNVRITSVRITKEGTIAHLVNADTNELIIGGDLNTLVDFCKYMDYKIINTKEMIENVSNILAKTLVDWDRLTETKK